MNLLNKISSLRLKRIKNIDTILDKVVEKNNINELWLVCEDLTDEQLKKLLVMPNLKSLCLRRNKLTPASIDTLAKFTRLQSLTIDCGWPEESKQLLKERIPFAKVDTILDHTYWPVITEQYRTEYEKLRERHHHRHHEEHEGSKGGEF